MEPQISIIIMNNFLIKMELRTIERPTRQARSQKQFFGRAKNKMGGQDYNIFENIRGCKQILFANLSIFSKICVFFSKICLFFRKCACFAMFSTLLEGQEYILGGQLPPSPVPPPPVATCLGRAI